MTRDEVLTRLKGAEHELRALGVARVALFGSVARGEAGPESDIDITVEIDSEAEERLDRFAYVGIVHAIEDLFTTRGDVSNSAFLRAFVRPSAERDALYAF